MEIKQSIGIEQNDILEKKHNLWIGVSFTNKEFNSKNITQILQFALEHTKEKVLIWLPGRMSATNYYYFEKLSRAESLKKAFEDEESMRNEISHIITSLNTQNIAIASYDDACTKDFIKRKELFFREFAKQEVFYFDVCDIAKDFVLARGRDATKKRVESVALYALQELPALIGGINTFDDDIHYSVLLYPCMGKIDILVKHLLEGKKYSKLTQLLSLNKHTGIADITLS